MAIDIPTTEEIIDRIVIDIETELGQTIPTLEKAVFKIQAQSYGGAIWSAYKKIQGVSLDILPTTARAEILEQFGIILNLPIQEATSTILTASTTGTNGETITAGTTYKGNTNNIVYVVLSNVIVAGGVATLSLQALEGGTIGNLDPGENLTIVTPQALISNSATVTIITTDGVNKETSEAYRERLIDRFRLRPQGGAKIDYIIWSQLVSGVTRVFPFTQLGGIIHVYFLRDNDTPRIPDANEISDVFNSIDQADRRPGAATLVVKAPTEIGFDVEITGFTGTPTEETAAETAVKNYFLARQPFVKGIDINDLKSKILQSDLIVITAIFASFTNLQLFKDTAPATPITSYTLLQSEVSEGSVTFV